ncbi:DUF2971 domain-containing protein [Mucilaginibacter rigui]|uniref:DUF2971 domain-containing protein n=1 Tax=Mucilaginibacter rigui TaxID=534635 RepID=A0ABR7X1Z6_9SPHI|nr:DUF2971 domain-containing protein [Mucilaginibacter rigui]MBD1384612.1 DUF2971 domain-containing protein [Mucilaginibacter rigui]
MHHRFIYEIGIVIHDKEVNIQLRSDKLKFDDAKLGLDAILNKFAETKAELETYGYRFNTSNTQVKFTAKYIATLSFYYFIPEKTKRRYIFKYMPVSLNSIKLLVNNELWFSDPRTFNDPFDTRYSIDADPKKEEIIDFYYKEAKKLVGSEALLLTDFIKTFKIPDRQVFLNDLEKHHYVNTIADQYGICCFSEKHADHLMWSHYADNTKGICLVFDLNVVPENDYYVFSGSKVKYRNSIIKKFYDGSRYMDTTEIIYSKYKNWKYEHEIRELMTFESGTNERTVAFDPKSLKGIIFGPKTSNKDKKTIKSLVGQLAKYHISFIESNIDLHSHSIRLLPNQLRLK